MSLPLSLILSRCDTFVVIVGIMIIFSQCIFPLFCLVFYYDWFLLLEKKKYYQINGHHRRHYNDAHKST